MTAPGLVTLSIETTEDDPEALSACMCESGTGDGGDGCDCYDCVSSD